MFLHGDRPAEANGQTPVPSATSPAPPASERQPSPLPSLKRSQPASPSVEEADEAQSKRLKVTASPNPAAASPAATSPAPPAQKESEDAAVQGTESIKAVSPLPPAEVAPSPAPAPTATSVEASAEASADKNEATEQAQDKSAAEVPTPAAEEVVMSNGDGNGDVKMADVEETTK